jgi:chromate transport protein ChrA
MPITIAVIINLRQILWRAAIVERRRWFSAADYVEGLALSQLAPGPLAAQLAIYLGLVGMVLKRAALP